MGFYAFHAFESLLNDKKPLKAFSRITHCANSYCAQSYLLKICTPRISGLDKN